MDDLPMVTASTGAIKSLLSKLKKSMQDSSSSSLKDARQDVPELERELGMVLASLLNLANRNDSDMQVMEWMRQARDVAYDAEDDIDLYTQAHQPAGPGRDPPAAAEKKTSSFKGRGSLFPWKPSTSKKLDIGKRIRELTLRMKEANERRKAYLVDPDAQQVTAAASSGAGNPSLPNSLPIDPRLLSAERDLLVGLDGPRDQLRDLVDVHGEKQLKVISILGTGGIGKTTLANEVSRAIHAPFHCRAFIRVGRNPRMKTILLGIFGQVAREQHDEVMEEQDIIKKLRGFLADKRYLIVLDDIRSISAWKVIKCALPEGSSGSRIITTTRSSEVADACSSHSCVHVMAPLNDSDSKTLFLSVISSWKETDWPQLEEIFSNIRRICGGVPLAVLAAAGLLTRKYSELLSWEKVKDYVVESLKQFPTMQEMRRILHISYSDLTLPLRTCFLYLSSFPENHTIEKDRLIWRWIAEGFIPASETGAESTSMWSKGEICFNELINRRLIHPVFSTNDVEPVGCTVHGAVLDFILSMSRDQNFVTTVAAGLRSMPPGVVRRLSLCCSCEEDESNNLALEPDDVNLSHVRALTVFGGSAWLTPLLENFQLLRVLDLQDAQNLEDNHLQCLGKFFHLTYLGLGGNGVKKLPDEVKYLQNLETLDVRQTSVKKLPESITGLKRLARLLARDFLLQDAMENMSELQELAMVRLTDMNSLQRLANLMKLKRLRILGVIWCLDDNENTNIAKDKVPVPFQGTQGKSSVECLLLDVRSDKHRSLDKMVGNWVPPSLLQKFAMTSSCCYFFPAIPPNMRDLDQLVHLTIAIAQLGEKDLQLLISLPALAILKLSTRDSTPNTTIISQGFPKLKVFSFKCQDGLLGFVFEEGSMPKLQDIQLCFKAGEEKNLQGINHLSTLRQVQATVNCDGAENSALKTAEEAIKKLVEAHPNKPSVQVIKDLKDDKNVNQNQGWHASKRTK